MNARESEKTFLEEFRTEHQMMVKCFTDFTPLIDAWKNLDIEQYPQYAALKTQVLEMWNARPELHGKHSDCSILYEHEDFIRSVICLKFSLDQITKPDGMFVAFAVSTMSPLWASDAMRELRMETRDFISDVENIRLSTMQNIMIRRIYDGKLDTSKLPMPRSNLMDILYYQPSPDVPKRYFRLRIDNELYVSKGWSVRMNAEGEPPPLNQEGLDRILENPYSPAHIRSIIDTSGFELNGVAFGWAEEITDFYQDAMIHKQLLNKDSLFSKKDLQSLRDQIRNMLKLPTLEMGLLLSPFDTESKRATWEPYIQSLRFSQSIDPRRLDENDTYHNAIKEPFVINGIEKIEHLKPLSERGFQSLLVTPLKLGKDFLGIVEFADCNLHTFTYEAMFRLAQIAADIASAIHLVQEGAQERMMAVIKQTCTAIHPAVEWRFQEMAKNYLEKQSKGEIAIPEPIVFEGVIPFYGGSDIRSSSKKRNDSIRADLLKQLELAADVIKTANQCHPRPVFNELLFRIGNHCNTISEGLRSGDEVRIYAFLRHVVESSFSELEEMGEPIKDSILIYRNQLDPKVGVVYQKRKSYDRSVSMINDELGAYLDRQQQLIQAILPHYFEKFKTDGVDYNMYVGDSLLENGTCSPLQLRNLYLWQLMVTCGIVWISKELKTQLPTPLDTAHLLLAQSAPLSISFHMEEKHFSVDGAYNARYEIVKKRIDKARILETNERLTQPDQIAIVYTQEREARMYKEFISYLHSLGYLKEQYIDVLLEDLQGVHGLRALRVQVQERPPAGWCKDRLQLM